MKNTGRELTVVLKGFGHSEGELSIFPIASKLLSRGKNSEAVVSASSDTLLFHLFGFDAKSGQDIPVAAVTRVMDLGIVDKGWWLRADPVHLAPGRQGLLMLANQGLELSNAESEGLIQEIIQSALEEGWILKAPNPHRWYLKPVETPRISTTPLDEVLGRDVEPCLPVGEDAKNWLTRLNEIQILLHTSQINSDRESRGKLAANSIWFWGGGTLPQLTSSKWNIVWSDDVVSVSLARLSDTEHKKFPSSFDQWLQEAKAGAHLIVSDQLQGSAEDFEEQWSAPMLSALKTSELDKLTLYFGPEKCVVVTPKDVKPRWNWRFPFGRSS